MPSATFLLSIAYWSGVRDIPLAALAAIESAEQAWFAIS